MAWPRLSIHRSGGGKARKERIHSCMLVPGRCHARSGFHALRKGKNGPQLAVGILGSRNTRLFRGSIPGNVPTGVEAFPGAIFWCTTLPKAVDWLPVPSLHKIADTLVNTVVFLPVALRYGTRTLFSFQGTTDRFSQRSKKVEMHEMQGLKPGTLTTGSKDPWLARAEAQLLS